MLTPLLNVDIYVLFLRYWVLYAPPFVTLYVPAHDTLGAKKIHFSSHEIFTK